MAAYESELTGFLRTLRQADPDLERRQRESRAIWWDGKTDPDDLQRWRAARAPTTPYVYYGGAKKITPAAGS